MSRAHSSISCAWGLAGKGGAEAALSASKPSSCGKRGGALGFGGRWGDVKVLVGSKPSWVPGKARAQLPSRVLPSLWWLGLSGLLCRRQIVCCCFSIWLESRLSSTVLFVARLPPVSCPFCLASWQGDVLGCTASAPPSGPSTPRGIPVHQRWKSCLRELSALKNRPLPEKSSLSP